MSFRPQQSSDRALSGVLLRALVVTAGATVILLAACAIGGSRQAALWCGVTGEVLLVLLLLVSLVASAHDQQSTAEPAAEAEPAQAEATAEPRASEARQWLTVVPSDAEGPAAETSLGLGPEAIVEPLAAEQPHGRASG